LFGDALVLQQGGDLGEPVGDDVELDGPGVGVGGDQVQSLTQRDRGDPEVRRTLELPCSGGQLVHRGLQHPLWLLGAQEVDPSLGTRCGHSNPQLVVTAVARSWLSPGVSPFRWAVVVRAAARGEHGDVVKGR